MTSCVALAIGLAGCSALETDKINYKSASRGNQLEVPPDLTQLSQSDARYAAPTVPGGRQSSASALDFQRSQQVDTNSSRDKVAATAVGDVSMERSGNERWLVVKRPADKLWDPVREFWQDNGFLLTIDQPNLGIMETDWAENRAKIPQDFIRASIGKLFDSAYDTGERDKFRTRIERSSDGSTEIFITHRGMVEVYTTSQKDETAWQPRPADPELETEFLRRLMVRLGATETQSQAVVANSKSTTPVVFASATTIDGAPAVQVDDSFDRAWRRVGLALDRTGFTVEDRDRSQGLYYVRYVPPDPNRKEPGFLGRMFGTGKPTEQPKRYRIALKSTEAGNTSVRVLSESGGVAPATDAQRIVTVLVDELK